MNTPKTIPDFGSDREGSAKRSQYIIEHADYFTTTCRYHRLGEYTSLFAAQKAAREQFTMAQQPIMIYAVYGPYDTWVENVGKETSEKGSNTQKGT